MKMSPGWMTSFRIWAWGSLRGDARTWFIVSVKTNVNGGRVVEIVGRVGRSGGGVVVVVGGAGNI
jgi:hypothetical protein